MGLFNFYKRTISNLSPQFAIHASEPQIAIFDFAYDIAYVKDLVTPANNFAGTIQAAINAGLIVFARSGVGKYFGDGGVYTEAATGVMRRVTDPLTKTAKGYLSEPTRTNLVLRSNTFANAAWTKVTCTATDAFQTIKGIPFARIQANAGGGQPICFQTVTGAGVTTGMVYSIFTARGSSATDGGHFRVRNSPTATDLCVCNLNYDTGVLTVSSGVATVVNLGDSCYRINIYLTTGISAGDALICYAGFVGSAGPTYAGGEYSLVAYGQLEAGVYPTSRIETAASTVTRNSDTCRVPWAKIPGTLTAYTHFSTFEIMSEIYQAYISSLNNNSINDSSNIASSTVGASVMWHTHRSGGVVAATNVSGTLPANSRVRVAGAAELNNFAICANGVIGVIGDGSGAMPTALQFLDIGFLTTSTSQPARPIESIVFVPRRVNNADLIIRTA